MAEVRWLKGDLVGACVGKPHRKVGGSGLARWYKLELVEAVVSQWQAVPGPPTTAPSGPEPFCQAKLRDVRLKARTPGAPDEELSVQQLSVWDWSIRDQREGGGESRCTLVGTVYAQEVPGTRRPALPDGADRLGRWGCLTLLLAALVAAWLWWSCGPFTCGLWAAVTLTSWWTHRARTRRRTPPALGSKILQGVLAFLLVLGGVGLTVVMYEPANASACTEVAALYLLAGVGVVVASSLLTISWQLPWTWVLWTAVVALWCGRTGTDCAAVWLERAQREVFPSATRPGAALEDLRRRVTGEPGDVGGSSPGAARPGGGGAGPSRPNGTGADATGSDGTGSGGTGPGGTGSGGTGPGGTGPGGTGPGGTGPGGTGPGGTGPGGTGPGGTGPGGTGPGGTGPGGTGSSDTGLGGTGSGGTGSGGTGSGGTGSGGTGSGGTGSGGTGSGGTGSGGTGSGGTGSGATAPGGTGLAGTGPRAPAAPSPGALADGEASLAAASEPRMSVEAAQRDPRPFLDGSTRITLDGDLLFAFDEDRLKPEAEPRLRAVAKLLREDPLTRVLLEGHADTIGGDQYNQGLSERRAQAVRAWLVEKAHLSPLQIDTVGYGNGKPLVPASRGPAAQAPNRRVEVLVLPR